MKKISLLLVLLMVALPANAQTTAKHPRWAAVGKYTGISWTYKHAIKPSVDWADDFGVRHQGLMNLAGFGFGAGTNALLGARGR